MNLNKVKTGIIKKTVQTSEPIDEKTERERKDEKERTVKLASEETRKQLMNSEELQGFINRNYKIIERVNKYLIINLGFK